MHKQLLLFFICILLGSCYTETSIPIEANFEYIIKEQDLSVPVILTFNNSSSGGDQYFWEFVGATPKDSNDKNPGEVFYNQPGSYKIRLTVTNIDGEKGVIEKEVRILDHIQIGFDYQIKGSNYPPVEIEIDNKTEGVDFVYTWEFEGGIPSVFSGVAPPKVRYEQPGVYTVKLTVENGQDVVVLTKEVQVDPDIVVDFDWDPIMEDYDYQAPVVLNLKNQSKNATTYQWSFPGTNLSQSADENPTVIYNAAGEYPITLTASNDKKAISKTKNIQIFDDTNLYVLKDIKLGNVYGHNTNQLAAFYSTHTRKTYFSNKVTADISGLIDLVFVGMTSDLSISKFISPSEIGSSGLVSFSGGQHVKFINSQELCGCDINFSISDFVAMEKDLPLRTLHIIETSGGKQFFNNQQQRIVLFETKDGRKGAIYIKEFVKVDNQISHIVCDIKVQKVKK